MGFKKSRKGQAEDIFGDLIVAIILIVITIITIGVKGGGHEEDTNRLSSAGMASMRGIDLITLHRASLEHDILKEHGYKAISFPDFLELVAKNYPEKDPGLEWLFGWGNILRKESFSSTITCREEFTGIINSKLGYNLWRIKVSDFASGKVIFECDNIGAKIPRGLALELDTFSYANMTIPTSIKRKNLFVEMESVI